MSFQKLLKNLFFTLTTLILVFALMETLARLTERFEPPQPVETRSPVTFQTLPDSSALETISIDGKDFLSLSWGGHPSALMPPKKGDELRIILLGGSAADGMGIAPPATFASILERLLNSISVRRVRVINMARTGFASSQLAWMLQQAAPLIEPDLVLTVMGNNEYLDMQLSQSVAMKPLQLTLARRLERRFALARFFRPGQKVVENVATENHLDAMQDMSEKRRETINDYVENRLKRSVRSMAVAAKSVGSRMIVSTVPANIRYANLREWFFAGDGPEQPQDFVTARWAMRYGAPMKAAAIMGKRLAQNASDHPARFVLAMALQKAGETKTALEVYQRLVKDLKPSSIAGGSFSEWYMLMSSMSELQEKTAAKQTAKLWFQRVEEKIDDAYGRWQRATMYMALGDIDKARQLFREALAMDGHVIRTGERINHVLKVAASAGGVRAFDLNTEFTRHEPDGILGYDYFFDYCHYNARGHILAAHLLAKPIAKALGIEGELASAKTGLEMERKLRKGRETDLPDLRWWSGADFDVSLLVDEAIDNNRNPRAELARHVAKFGDSAAASTFLGNWMIAERNDAFEISGKASENQYRKALEMSPDFEPAKNNLKKFMTFLR